MIGPLGVPEGVRNVVGCFREGVGLLESTISRVALQILSGFPTINGCCQKPARDPEREPLLECDFIKVFKTVDDIDPAHEKKIACARQKFLELAASHKGLIRLEGSKLRLDPQLFYFSLKCFQEAEFPDDFSRPYKAQLVINILFEREWLKSNCIPLNCWRVRLEEAPISLSFNSFCRDAGSFFRVCKEERVFIEEAERWLSYPLLDMKKRGLIPGFYVNALMLQQVELHSKLFVFKFLLGDPGNEVAEFEGSLKIEKQAGGVPKVGVKLFENFEFYPDIDPGLFLKIVYELAGVRVICDNDPK